MKLQSLQLWLIILDHLFALRISVLNDVKDVKRRLRCLHTGSLKNLQLWVSFVLNIPEMIILFLSSVSAYVCFDYVY